MFFRSRQKIDCPICREPAIGEIPKNFAIETILDGIREIGNDDSIPILDRNLKIEINALKKRNEEVESLLNKQKMEIDVWKNIVGPPSVIVFISLCA